MIRAVSQLITKWIVVIFILAFLTLAYSTPHWPKTFNGWIFLVLVGGPAILAFEGIWEFILKPYEASRIGLWVQQKAGEKSFSILRVGILFIFVSVFMGLMAASFFAIERFTFIGRFLEQNFYGF